MLTSDDPQHVIFVGGFAASDYLLDQVTEGLSRTGLHIFRPESHVCVCSSVRGEVSHNRLNIQLIKPYLMALPHSISTISCALV